MNKFKPQKTKPAKAETPSAGFISKFKDKTLLRFLRNQFAAALREEQGLGFFESRNVADEADDDLLAECCAKVGVDAPKATGRSGGFFDWVANIDPEKIKKIIDIVMYFIGAFKTQGDARQRMTAAIAPAEPPAPTTADGGTTLEGATDEPADAK